VPPLDPARLALRNALASHQPLDPDEAAHRDAILRLVETEPACFARTTYTPGHVTGSLFIACASTGKVLLHHHRRLGKWLQMGGHDDGEHDPAATALREGREESGLADLTLLSPVILDVDVHSIPAGKGEPPHIHHDVRFAGLTRTPDAIVLDEAESHSLRWFDLDEAADKMGEAGSRRALNRIALLLRSL
jgi:8-oxo-dGTP pyrophosphatase MutT (NUDIX family)